MRGPARQPAPPRTLIEFGNRAGTRIAAATGGKDLAWEFTADHLGLLYMAKARYDPHAARRPVGPHGPAHHR